MGKKNKKLVLILCFGGLLATLAIFAPEKLIDGKTDLSFWFQISLLASFSFLGVKLGDLFGIPDIVLMIAVAILLGSESPIGVLNFSSEKLAWLAVMFKVLNNGISVDLKGALSQRRKILIYGLTSFIFPFLLVILIGRLVEDGFFSTFLFQGDFYNFNFFLVCALSFAAAPLALVDNILDSAHVRRTPYGSMVIAYQALNEIITWSVFAILIIYFERGELNPSLAISQSAVLIGLTLVAGFAAHRYGDKLSDALERRSTGSTPIVATITIVTLMATSFMDAVYHGGIITALLIGLIVGNSSYVQSVFTSYGESFLKYVCLPIFFYQSFVGVDILSVFSIELFLAIIIIGAIPSYLGVFFSALLMRLGLNTAHQHALTAAPIGISSIVVVQFLMPAGAPGKEELLASLALAVPLSSLVGVVLLKDSFSLLKRLNLKESFKRGGLIFLENTPEDRLMNRSSRFKLENELSKLYLESTNQASLSQSEKLLLSSVLQNSRSAELSDGRLCQTVSLPLPVTGAGLRLFFILPGIAQLKWKGNQIAMAIILAYPTRRREIIDNVDSSLDYFTKALDEENQWLVRKILGALEDRNPAESIQETLEDVDEIVSSQKLAA